MDKITTLPTVTSPPQVMIAVAPETVPWVWTDGTNTFDSGVNMLDRGVELTFTATVDCYGTDQDIVGYEWAFGDGQFGYANPVGHTYTTPTDTMQLVLTVIDTFGQRFHTRKQIYLNPPNPTYGLWPADWLYPSDDLIPGT